MKVGLVDSWCDTLFFCQFEQKGLFYNLSRDLLLPMHLMLFREVHWSTLVLPFLFFVSKKAYMFMNAFHICYSCFDWKNSMLLLTRRMSGKLARGVTSSRDWWRSLKRVLIKPVYLWQRWSLYGKFRYWIVHFKVWPEIERFMTIHWLELLDCRLASDQCQCFFFN